MMSHHFGVRVARQYFWHSVIRCYMTLKSANPDSRDWQMIAKGQANKRA